MVLQQMRMDRWSDMSDCPNCGYNPGKDDELHIPFLPLGGEQKCELWETKGSGPEWRVVGIVRVVKN